MARDDGSIFQVKTLFSKGKRVMCHVIVGFVYLRFLVYQSVCNYEASSACQLACIGTFL